MIKATVMCSIQEIFLAIVEVVLKGIITICLLFSIQILLFVASTPMIAVLLLEKMPPTSIQPSSITPGREVDQVSGLYGPGAYSAWVLSTISAIISSATEDNSSSSISTDQLASFLYSTCSMYWYHGRLARYRLTIGPDIIQDYSVQAASFVFNVSTLFHSLGCIFSTEQKRFPWLIIVLWDAWLSWICPMMFTSPVSLAIHLLILPFILVLLIWFKTTRNPNIRKLALLFLPFALLEAVRCQFSTTRILIIPKTTSKLFDLDQLVSLITVMVVIAYQWELWNVPKVARKLRTRFGRTLVRRHSLQLEASEIAPHYHWNDTRTISH
jgi:hypothetical protein